MTTRFTMDGPSGRVSALRWDGPADRVPVLLLHPVNTAAAVWPRISTCSACWASRSTRSIAAAGLDVDESGAGLYLWVAARDGRSGTQLAEWFAERGILTAPGHLYGDDRHTRVALTSTDAQIAETVSRLTET